MSAFLDLAHHHVTNLAVTNLAADNPFGNLVPDFTVFGAKFTTWWQKLFTGVWALCILAAGTFLIISITQLRRATTNNIPGQADEAKSHTVWAAISLGALVGFAVIMTAIFAIFG